MRRLGGWPAIVDWGERELRLTEQVSVLVGADNGKYPSGNSLLVRGGGEAVIIDPSVDVVALGGAPARIDAVINSHSHEDHMPGNGLFADARVHIHDDDLPGARSLDGLMEVYGLTGQAREEFAAQVIEEFNYTPGPTPKGSPTATSGTSAASQVEAVHLPGHTRGHSGFRITGGVFFLSDIDLTGFGPYYGDVWSDLEQFEQSLIEVRDEHAEYYVTFHHKGVIEGRERVPRAARRVPGGDPPPASRRCSSSSPSRTRSTTWSAHRFIYRPHVEHVFADSVERRCAAMHVQRMLVRGEAVEVDPGTYQAA